MLDPASLLKPGAEGVPVVMADGREWLVRRPRIGWSYSDSDAGYDIGFDLGPEYSTLAAKLDGAANRGEEVGALMRMFAFLLRLNYDLDAESLRTLLFVKLPTSRDEGDDSAEDPAERRFLDLAAVATGESPAPKVGTAGSA